MDFGTALSAYLCFLAIIMVSAQLLFILNALRAHSGPIPAGLALSHSVLLSSDDKGPDHHCDESEDDLDADQSRGAGRGERYEETEA